MADHLLQALQAAPADARAVVWAHNSHIAARQTGSFPPLGGFLRKAFGAQYYAVATAFHRGSFQAQVTGVSPPQIREFSLPPAPQGTIDWFLRQAAPGAAMLDLRQRPSDPRIGQWLDAEHPMYWVGGLFSEQSIAVRSFVLSRDFDGILFVESTTRARPLDR
jgi:erythromycin esterase